MISGATNSIRNTEQFDTIRLERAQEIKESRECVEKTTEAKEQVEQDMYSYQMGALASGNYKHMLDTNSLFSICHVSVAETVNVYKSEGLSGENMIYEVQGIDMDGRYYKKAVNVGNA